MIEVIKEKGIPENCMEITVPICRVTITEDQADIYRETSVQWEKGSVNILIKNVTPYIIDRTLWAEVISNDRQSRPEIGSTRTIRRLIREKNFQEKIIMDSLEILYGKILSLYNRRESLKKFYSGVETGFNPAIEQLIEEVLLSGVMPDNYTSQLDVILEEINNFHVENHQIMDELDECFGKLKKIREEIYVNPSSLSKEGYILISMEAKSSGTGIIRCGYQVPRAQWRPRHEAHLLEDDKIRLITQGALWQNTGENWEDVSLTLSTSKPSLGLDIILPPEDKLYIRRKTPQERKKIHVDIMDRIISKTGIEDKETGEPPLPSDGGETQFYMVPEKVNIPSNGKPYIINIEELDLVGETELIAIPEIDNKAYVRSLIKNTQKRPILAGPVILHRKGTFIGNGDIEFVSSNSYFHLWWGSEDLLEIGRSYSSTEKSSILQNKCISRTVTLYVHNLTGNERRLKIQERIPVSELEQVMITVKQLPENTEKPDKNGFIFIPVALGPREEKELVIMYDMEVDKEVSIDFFRTGNDYRQAII